MLREVCDLKTIKNSLTYGTNKPNTFHYKPNIPNSCHINSYFIPFELLWRPGPVQIDKNSNNKSKMTCEMFARGTDDVNKCGPQKPTRMNVTDIWIKSGMGVRVHREEKVYL